MKNEIRLALLCLVTSAAPAFAQNALPPCGATNFDEARGLFTIMNPTADAVNQQCILTVYPSGTRPNLAGQFPASYLAEGTYVIELSGGGGGGGGGAAKDQGGGGGGAGAAPLRTAKYLSPGVYKLTIGTGGDGGSASGGRTEAGNPTSLTNANTGQLIAGFQGADRWTQQTQAATDGHGGVAALGGSKGGDGGDSGLKKDDDTAQSGGMSGTAGYAGKPGQSGVESGRIAQTDAGRVVQANAGGGGGASVGSGGAGESVNSKAVAGIGNLGGGGGGGRGGLNTADAGGRGGHGFIRLTMSGLAPQAIAPEIPPVPVVVTRVIEKYSLSADALFGFGQSTLNPAGEAKLDNLVDKLRQLNIDRITDTGHADRIGSHDSNQKMSVMRAESVKAYLVSRGVASDRIAVVGKGETEPASGSDACKGAATPKVIACLQPDRRVDIEVVGTRKTSGMN